jgi:hypothetical protein
VVTETIEMVRNDNIMKMKAQLQGAPKPLGTLL